METQIQGDGIVEQAIQFVDDYDRLSEAYIDLQQMAGAVVAAEELGDPTRLQIAIRAMKNTLLAAGVTGLGQPVQTWPPAVGTVFTYTDDDGVAWPGCVVRSQKGFPVSGSCVRFDNGDHAVDDFQTNGATVYGWARRDEVTYG